MAAGIYEICQYAKIDTLTKEDWPGQAVLFLCVRGGNIYAAPAGRAEKGLLDVRWHGLYSGVERGEGKHGTGTVFDF